MKKMTKVPTIARQIASMTSAAIGSKAIGMIRGIILARVLGPTGYGTLNGLTLITTYSELSHLGTLNAMARDMPIAIGAGDRRGADHTGKVAFSFSVLTAALVAVVVICYALLADIALPLRVALVGMGLLVLSQRLLRYLQTRARVEMEFHLVALLRLGNVALQLILCVALAIPFGVVGAVFGILIAQAIVTLVGWRSFKKRITPVFDWKRLKPLMRLGLSLLWITSLYTVLNSIDRLLILKWLGTEQLGVYAIALLAVSLMAFVPCAVGQVISPRIMRAYGGGQSVTHLLRQPILLLSLLLPIIGGVGAAMVPFVITRLLPAYSGAIVPSQVLLLSYTPYAARSFAAEVLVASDLISRIAMLQIVGLVIAIAVCGSALMAGHGIVGVSCGMAAMYWFFGISILVAAERAVASPPMAVVRLLLRVILPTFWVAGWILVGYQVVNRLGFSTTDAEGVVILLVFLFVGAVPLLLGAWNQVRSLLLTNMKGAE